MSSIRIAGDTSGEIILSAPSVAGTNTITLPAVTGTILTTAYTGDVTFSGDLTVDTNTLYVDSTNNRVGVGKSNPSVPLDVNGITRTANAYSLSYPGVPGSTSAFGAGTISADSNWGMYFRATTGAAIADFAWVNGANTERMRITSSGGVSFGSSGTAYGTSGQVLTSSGNAPPTWTDPAEGITYVVKTANYTASANEGVIADTSGGAFTVTLPASPSTGDQVVIADGADWSTNNLTVGRNGSTIDGTAEDLVCDLEGVSIQFVYDGSTWEVYALAASSTDLSDFAKYGDTTANFTGTLQNGGSNVLVDTDIGSTVGYPNIPAVGTKTTSYTLATGDVGKYVQVGTGGSITIPNSTFSEGDAITIFNNTTGNVTITCSITTAYIAGTDTDVASVTLATRGLATILFISGTVCAISGNVS